MGSAFVNEFNYLGRTYQVTAQADAPNRLTPDDISRIKVRNKKGEMVPLGTITTQQNISGPSRIPRFNLYPAASLNGNIAPGYSSAEALDRMEQLANEILPQGISYEWTELAYQEKQTGNTAGIAFLLAVVFVFLLLAAQFESLVLPLVVIFIVPMVLLSAMIGIDLAGLDNNIMVQIGLIVLVGLASKNSILIVEFAKQLEDQGKDLKTAVMEAAKLRLRPILMTALAFILGVVPLAIATGAGAELRVSLGIAVFSGMLGVTLFGIFLTPVFYYLGRKWTSRPFRSSTIKPAPSNIENAELT
jgi:multidrug efflux pump subunit AcrB